MIFANHPVLATRRFYGSHLNPTHTIHLDSIAVGCMIGIALRVFDWSPVVWKWIARAGLSNISGN